MILNDRVTGRPKVDAAGSIFRMQRTAASITLASNVLATGEQEGHTDFPHSSLANILPGNTNLPKRARQRWRRYAHQIIPALTP
jgi:hypothetical protein